MQAQLYRFRIESEASRGTFAAIDEADQARVWLVGVESARASLSSLRPELDKIALAENCEYFTAGARFYFVAATQAQSAGLRAQVAALGLGPAQAAAPPAGQALPAIPRKTKVIAASILALIAAILVIAVLWPNAQAAPPHFSTAGTSLEIRDDTAGAVIHFTVDGTTPTANSQAYTQPLRNLRDGALVQAIATAPQHAPSSVSQFAYAAPEWLTAYNKGEEYLKTGRFPQARSALAVACRGEALDACNDLAKLYYYGKGGPMEAGKARQVLGSACERGNLAGCASAGRLYQLDGNAAEAARYFQKACAGGVQIACNQLREAR